jgi:hypothetical protein
VVRTGRFNFFSSQATLSRSTGPPARQRKGDSCSNEGQTEGQFLGTSLAPNKVPSRKVATLGFSGFRALAHAIRGRGHLFKMPKRRISGEERGSDRRSPQNANRCSLISNRYQIRKRILRNNLRRHSEWPGSSGSRPPAFAVRTCTCPTTNRGDG